MPMSGIAEQSEPSLAVGSCMVSLRDDPWRLDSHEIPCFVQMEYSGCVSSHLTRRALHRLQPLRDFF